MTQGRPWTDYIEFIFAIGLIVCALMGFILPESERMRKVFWYLLCAMFGIAWMFFLFIIGEG